jgi:hypothetical protein
MGSLTPAAGFPGSRPSSVAQSNSFERSARRFRGLRRLPLHREPALGQVLDEPADVLLRDPVDGPIPPPRENVGRELPAVQGVAARPLEGLGVAFQVELGEPGHGLDLDLGLFPGGRPVRLRVLAGGDLPQLHFGELPGLGQRDPRVGPELQVPPPVALLPAVEDEPDPLAGLVHPEDETLDLLVPELSLVEPRWDLRVADLAVRQPHGVTSCLLRIPHQLLYGKTDWHSR